MSDTNSHKGQPSLSNAQKKYLRKLSHDLNPLAFIGKEGLGENVYDAIDSALESHELIKVKILNNSPVHKKEAAETVPRASGSTLVQLIGKTLILYRESRKIKKQDRIKLPRD